MNYVEFLDKKSQLGTNDGFNPIYMPDFLYDFQKALVGWALLRGRSAIFADCGLGKTPMQLTWAENVIRKTNKSVLILAPLAVSAQTVREGEKFGIEVTRSKDGTFKKGIVVANYERLHYFNPDDFIGMVCDESSILKSFDGKTKDAVTVFMRKLPYRLLCTATAAPNDYVELGTSSEALGELGAMDMMNRFFKNDMNNSTVGRFCGKKVQWRLKGHAEIPFWRWVISWARAVRTPSDLGFDDGDFILPPLNENDHLVETSKKPEGFLFNLPAVGLREQREERRRSIEDRCEKAASLVEHTKRPALMWCHLNDEGDMLERLVPDAIQISGKDSDDAKEEKFLSFISGESRVLVTKPKIGAWGLNLQHCNHIVFFTSHSYEQYYQGVRRCWRFGQKNPVTVDMITTPGDRYVAENLRRKSEQADVMFANLVGEMNNAMGINRNTKYTVDEEVPGWLS